MRSALLALLALAAGAAAQTPPPPAAPAETLNPVGIANAVAFRWADVAPIVPPPDSGAVADGEGRLVWLAPDAETDRLDVWVRRGTVDAVTFTASAPARIAELEAAAARLREALGSPADGDFWTAAQLRTLPGERPYVDLAVRPERGEYALRKPAAPPPAPPPGQ